MNIKNVIANIDKVEASKKFVRFTTAMSVGAAIKNIVADNVPAHDNKIVNLAVNASCYIGGTVAAGYVLKHLGEYTDEAIDELFANFQTQSDEDDDSSEIVIEAPVL